jgi:hypothetical protein
MAHALSPIGKDCAVSRWCVLYLPNTVAFFHIPSLGKAQSPK